MSETLTDAEAVDILRLEAADAQDISARSASMRKSSFGRMAAACHRGADAIEECARLREALVNFTEWLDTPLWRRRMRDIGGHTEEFYNDAVAQARAALGGE